MIYQEFPHIPIEHRNRCPAAALVHETQEQLYWLGTRPYPLFGMIHDAALEVIGGPCEESLGCENCVLGGLAKITADIKRWTKQSAEAHDLLKGTSLRINTHGNNHTDTLTSGELS